MNERRAYRVRTGSGYIWRDEYVPMVVKNSNDHKSLKIYIIWPYDYLFDRNTYTALGWKLIQIETTHHESTVLDDVEDCEGRSDDWRCPTEADRNKKYKDEEMIISGKHAVLKQWILEHLRRYECRKTNGNQSEIWYKPRNDSILV